MARREEWRAEHGDARRLRRGGLPIRRVAPAARDPRARPANCSIRTPRNGWWRLVRVKLRAGLTRILFDVHRSSGVVLFVLLMLATLTGVKGSVMMLAHENMRVSHVTTHCALSEVPKRVTPQLRPEDADMPISSWIDPDNFNPNYLMRAMHLLPRRGNKPEWQHTQDYWTEKDAFPAIDLDGLMAHVPGPDFPTAASINGAAGIREAYATGRGKIYLRARVEIEEDKKTGKASLVIVELPYQVNKAHLLEKVAELVKEKRIEGITEIRDESDKDGMRAVIELRRGEVPEVVLNHLYQQTQLQSVFGINMVALVDGQPRQLTLHEVLDAFIRHRREVVSRRSLFALRKARERLHILEGLAVALANIERVIALIRGSQTTDEARAKLTAEGFAPGFVGEMLARALGADAQRPTETGRGLIDGAYYLSDRQAQAILDMRLQRLTGLERDKIVDEYGELVAQIIDLLDILGSETRLLSEIRRELLEIRDQYGDKRRTEIMVNRLDLTSEDLIAEQDVVVTFSHQGYVKSQPVSEYRAQHRGGRGRSAARVKEEDFIERLFVASSHDTLLCFSSAGKVYWLKVYELPMAGSGSRGRPIVNLLPLGEGEKVSAVLAVREFAADRYVVFATRRGLIKKTALADYSRPRSAGIIALDILDGDALVDVALTGGHDHVLLFTDDGKVLRFDEGDVRAMGRDARGVRGMNVRDDQAVIGMVVAQAGGDILTVTANGYGKRTPLADYPLRGRGGMGVISIQTTARNGQVVGAVQVAADAEVMLVTNAGTAIRTKVASISLLGRNTQGVTLMGVGEGEQLAGLAVVAPEETSEGDDESAVLDGADADAPSDGPDAGAAPDDTADDEPAQD